MIPVDAQTRMASECVQRGGLVETCIGTAMAKIVVLLVCRGRIEHVGTMGLEQLSALVPRIVLVLIIFHVDRRRI